MTRFYLLKLSCLLLGALKGDWWRDWFGWIVYGPNSRSSVETSRRAAHLYISLGTHMRICCISCSANPICTRDIHDGPTQPSRRQSKCILKNQQSYFANFVFKAQDEQQHQTFYSLHPFQHKPNPHPIRDQKRARIIVNIFV